MADGRVDYEVGRQPEALGQVRNTYIVARSFAGLVVIDQHAAHEAVLVEQLLAGAESLPLSPPARLDLTPREAELLTAHLALLSDLGLEIEPFGGASFLVRAVPGPLLEGDLTALLAETLEELAAGRALEPNALRERVAGKAACRAAVKAGDVLAPDQQQALLDDLQAAWSPSVCPHGRPVLFTLTVEDMERRFLRR
jgi:DNA mismatch repair protein MutL